MYNSFFYVIFIWSIMISCQDGEPNQSAQAGGEQETKDSTQKEEPSTSPSLLPQHEETERENWQMPHLVVDEMGDLREKTIVDLGAGSGYFTFRILPLAGKVISVDIDPKMTALLETLREDLPEIYRRKLEVRLADDRDPKLEDGEADVIFLSNTYAYIQDRVDYFRRLHEKLKPGGMVMIVDFKRKRIPMDIPDTDRLPLFLVEEELEEAGYDLITSDDRSLPYQYIVKAR